MKKYCYLLLVAIIVLLGAERCLYNSYIIAIEKNDEKKIDKIQDMPFISLNRCGGEGWMLSFLSEVECYTPLEAACIAGNLESAETLISRGADAGKTREGHFSTVYLILQTTHANDLENLKLLIANGANPTGMTKTSALDENSLQQISCRLVTTDQDSNENVFAAGTYQEETAAQSVEIYRYLEQEIGQDAPTNEVGETTLMHAVSFKNIALVEYLLENGSSVNQSDEHGQTAIFHLVDEEGIVYDDAWRKEIFDLLIHAGADLTVKDKDGLSVLEYAERAGDDYMVSLLRDAMS